MKNSTSDPALNSRLRDKRGSKTAKNSIQTNWFVCAQNNIVEEMKSIYYHHKHFDVNTADSKGRTALILASRGDCTDVVKWLLSLDGIDISAIDDKNNTALHLALAQGENNRLIVESLCQSGANVNARSFNNWTPLMIAAGKNNVWACEFLLSFDADLTMTTEDGFTCIDIAEDCGSILCFTYLTDVFEIKLGFPYVKNLSQDRRSSYGLMPFYVTNETTANKNPNIRPVARSESLSRKNGYGNLNETFMTNLPRSKSTKRRGERNQQATGAVAQPETPVTTTRKVWRLFSICVTCCFPPSLLALFGMKDTDVRQAWREKVTSCFIILVITLFYAFLSFGLQKTICQHKNLYTQQTAKQLYITPLIVRGNMFNLTAFNPGHYGILEADMLKFANTQVNYLFPSSPNPCSSYTFPARSDCSNTSLGQNYCHDPDMYISSSLILAQFVFTWDQVDGNNALFVYNQKVYDLQSYKTDTSVLPNIFKDSDFDELIKSQGGRDATLEFAKKWSIVNPHWDCFHEKYYFSDVDNTTGGCISGTIISGVAMGILVTIILTKFFCAVYFNWVLSSALGKLSKTKTPVSYVIMLVTCYSEGEDSLRTTCDSLCATDYDDQKKLLFIIADGDVTGSGNPKSTPDLCKDLVDISEDSQDPEPKGYFSIGIGSKRNNMCKVYSGYYEAEGHLVPTILVIKCGTPLEASGPKAGNRGKRDSQLILMQFFSRVTFNERMTPLDYELFTKIRKVAGVLPTKYEIVCMVDADTLVKPDSLKRMVFAMERDPKVMGLCGETKIANKRQSITTCIQVYEYFISHHLGKSFESIFGGVTCLPGCFCMYRIKVMNMDGTATPILANPDVVEEYSENVIDTLHKKNLLLLGEDRYLTTLMLRAFPKRKLIFVPKAVCKTVVPDEFKVLLSQRRRWINSTIHNLLELVFVKELCGIFCFSMQFVIFLELIGTVLLPSSLCFLIYLVYDTIHAVVIKDVTTYTNNILPLGFFVGVLFSQAFLVLFTKRKISYVGWMLVFILAMPVWNFILPLYAFWHFDDVSWGATRKIFGADPGHGEGGTKEPEVDYTPSLKYWHEYERGMGKKGRGYSSGKPRGGGGAGVNRMKQARASAYSNTMSSDIIPTYNQGTTNYETYEMQRRGPSRLREPSYFDESSYGNSTMYEDDPSLYSDLSNGIDTRNSQSYASSSRQSQRRPQPPRQVVTRQPPAEYSRDRYSRR